MIHCFLDDSGKDGQSSNPWVIMAGYLLGFDAVVNLNEKWLQLLMKHRISEIHMKDLIPLVGMYVKLGWEIPKRDEVLQEFVQVIREAKLIGVGVAVEMAAWNKQKKDHPELTWGAGVQQFCLERILSRMIEMLHDAGVDEKIALVFDTDPEFGANRFNLFCALMGHDPRAAQRLTSITFGHPAHYPGLQCADVLAWETRKEQIQKAGGYKSTKRWDQLFAAMPEYSLDYMGERWDDAQFEKAMPEILENEAKRAKAAAEAASASATKKSPA